MRWVLVGPPGSGKGTQASKIAARYGILHLSTGETLRQAVREGTTLGKEAQAFMDRGELVPDEIIDNLVQHRIEEPSCANGYLLDGYPRTIAQAESLDRVLAEKGQHLNGVVSLEVPPADVVGRLSGRRVCRSCGALTHSEANEQAKKGVCSQCGGELYQRSDDHPDVIRSRLEVYRRQTEPLLEYYSRKGLVKAVNGVGDVDAIFNAICSLIDNG